MEKFVYAKLADGTVIDAFKMVNKNGAEMTVMTYGGRILSLKMPDRNGKIDDVLLGFDSIDAYLKDTSGQGALIGRYGNRIGKGIFSLNGKTYQLALNNGANHLHGGNVGYGARIWDAEIIGDCKLALSLISPDGEENYPGTLKITVTYTLTDDNELNIRYTAVSDKDTIVNLTNHSYFNLTNTTDASILDHYMQVESDYITPVDSGLIPTGEFMPVNGTAFDFNTSKQIGRDIDSDEEQMRFGFGYDHNFVLKGEGYRRVITLYSKESGRKMDVYTDQCGVQIYSANMLNDPNWPLCGNRPQQPRIAIALETQHYPDTPNHDNFPSCVLRAGEIYDTTTAYRFSVE